MLLGFFILSKRCCVLLTKNRVFPLHNSWVNGRFSFILRPQLKTKIHPLSPFPSPLFNPLFLRYSIREKDLILMKIQLEKKEKSPCGDNFFVSKIIIVVGPERFELSTKGL